MDVRERLMSRVETRASGCWEFVGPRFSQGYGKFNYDGDQLAHRVSYRLFKAEFEKELCVLHRCDNPPCVNPLHLFLGTRDLNNKDRAAKGRNNHRNEGKTHCKRGHEFTEANTYVRRSGARLCRKCNLQRYYDRKQADGAT